MVSFKGNGSSDLLTPGGTRAAASTRHDYETDAFTSLPHELASHVLASGILSMRDIVRLSRASRAWHAICNNEAILQRAAYAWGYIDDLSIPLKVHAESIKDEQGYFASAGTSWKRFCLAHHCLEEQITGYPTQAGNHPKGGVRVEYPKVSYDFAAAQSQDEKDEVYEDTWHIKIDEEERTIISSGIRGQGGIRVSCLDSKELLWSGKHFRLDNGNFTQIESEKGYIIAANSSDELEHECLWNNLMIFKSDRLCENRAEEAQRGHYHQHWMIRGFDDGLPFIMRFHHPVLAAYTDFNEMIFWNVETKTEESRIDCAIYGSKVFSIDFDDHYAFVVGRHNFNVNAFDRATGEHVWRISKDHVPSMLAFRSDQLLPPKFPCGLFPEERTGVAAQPVLHELGENALDAWEQGFDPWELLALDPRVTPHSWRAVQICLETNALVLCGESVMVIMKDYKAFFRSEGLVRPGFYVAIQFDEMGACYTEEAEQRHRVALSVRAGRALFCSRDTYLVDFKHATSPSEIKITQLKECLSAHQLDATSGTTDNAAHIEPDDATDLQADAVSRLLFKQSRRTNYLHRGLRCSSAVLTSVAAYKVELQCLRRSLFSDPTKTLELKGTSGREGSSPYFIRAVRCYDFARSALYKFDRGECQQQVARLKDFQTTSMTVESMFAKMLAAQRDNEIRIEFFDFFDVHPTEDSNQEELSDEVTRMFGLQSSRTPPGIVSRRI